MYNEIVQDHYRHPRNLGHLESPDGVGEASIREPNVDWIQISLRLEDGRIAEARFRAIGCAATVAAGSAMTEWLTDRPIAAALQLTSTTVLEVLGGLPDDKRYCAELASAAVRAAAQAAEREGREGVARSSAARQTIVPPAYSEREAKANDDG